MNSRSMKTVGWRPATVAFAAGCIVACGPGGTPKPKDGPAAAATPRAPAARATAIAATAAASPSEPPRPQCPPWRRPSPRDKGRFPITVSPPDAPPPALIGLKPNAPHLQGKPNPSGCVCGNQRADVCMTPEPACNRPGDASCGGRRGVRPTRTEEPCDGPDLRGQSCQSFGYPSGRLVCDGCALDVSRCKACPPGAVCRDMSKTLGGIQRLFANDTRIALLEGGHSRNRPTQVILLDKSMRQTGSAELRSTHAQRGAATPGGFWFEERNAKGELWLSFMDNDGGGRASMFATENVRTWLHALLQTRFESGALTTPLAVLAFADQRVRIVELSHPPRTIYTGPMPYGSVATSRWSSAVRLADGWLLPRSLGLPIKLRDDGEFEELPQAGYDCARGASVIGNDGLWLSAASGIYDGALMRLDNDVKVQGEPLIKSDMTGVAFHSAGQSLTLFPITGGVVAFLNARELVAVDSVSGKGVGFRPLYGRRGAKDIATMNGELLLLWDHGHAPYVGRVTVPLSKP